MQECMRAFTLSHNAASCFCAANRGGCLVDALQRECRIVVTGPTTLMALLNSLRMGFRTLAIQKRSSEVWQVLAAVKTEFGKYGEVLEKVRRKGDMPRRTLVYTALLMAVTAAAGVVVMDRASAAQPQIPGVSLVGNEATTDCVDRAPAAQRQIPGVSLVGGDATARSVTLGIDKSIMIDLPRDIKEVLVASPAIANAVVRSSRRAYIIGNKVGQTNVFFLDADGKQMAGFDIAVTRDLDGLRAALKRALPGTDVDIEGVADGVELTGNVATPLEAQKAFNLASRLVGSNDKVVNDITVHGNDQVMLKVTIAEMDRTVIKQLGVNLNGSLSLGTSVVNFNNNNPFPVNGAPSTLAIAPAVTANNILTALGTPAIAPSALNPAGTPASGLSSSAPGTIGGTFGGVTANLQAMEQVGMARTLAEPTLTAISGESAHFLVGGQFPYPTQATSIGSLPGISFQNFGVALSFTPVVLSEGRISLHVATEVSELNDAISVTVAGTTVPGLSVRRADTTVEIPSGGTLAMAGMLQEQTKQTITGFPGLMQVPILGTLFKSNDYLNSQTELVALVTPYIVRAVAQKDLSRPDDGFADASDPASVLLGRLNRIYGVGGIPDPPENYRGKYGFILD